MAKCLLLCRADIRIIGGNIFIHDGVLQKMLRIKKAFEQSKFFSKVDLLLLYGNFLTFHDESSDLNERLKSRFRFAEKREKGLLRYLLKEQKELWQRVLEIASKYDVIYVRFFNDSGLHRYLFRKFKGIKVVEMFTNSTGIIHEISQNKSINPVKRYLIILKYLFNILVTIRRASIVLVIGDLGFIENLYKEKCLVVDNGIDVDDIKQIRHHRGMDEIKEKDVIRLIGVGHLAFWHGYDRVIRGIAEYYKEHSYPKVVFHIVGEGEEKANLESLVDELNLHEFVKFEGLKTGEELSNLFDICDIGIGSLGFHRLGLFTGAPLKHREYCARGIPFVLGVEDKDFSNGFPFAYKASATEEPLNIKKLINWYEELINRYPNFINDIRRYAESNLSWNAKLNPLLRTIAKMLQKNDTMTFIEDAY